MDSQQAQQPDLDLSCCSLPPFERGIGLGAAAPPSRAMHGWHLQHSCDTARMAALLSSSLTRRPAGLAGIGDATATDGSAATAGT